MTAKNHGTTSMDFLETPSAASAIHGAIRCRETAEMGKSPLAAAQRVQEDADPSYLLQASG